MLILGIAGACRSDELVNLKMDDIKDVKSALIISIPKTKTKKPRSFTVLGEDYLSLFRKYVGLRPVGWEERRLFVRYVNGKCHKMVVGIHTISAVPQEIAKFLKIDNWKEYTGHTLRRTSATLLVDAGADLTCLKRHGGWTSSTTAEGYIEESSLSKENIAKKILQPKIPQAGPSSEISTISESHFTSDFERNGTNIIISSAQEDVLRCCENGPTKESAGQSVCTGLGTGSSSGSLFNFSSCESCTFNITVNK